ncbi:MAG TPA: DUF1697 domain-containing protein [Candidatus Baltobacteraceae bacterium]|jgi:uncharacterized protein (DUF1697 family)|nr:DUF1697 domain-containing protein [Candidatus Baltobacteraceae bacterium]
MNSIALLRAVNVSGKNRVSMADLKELLGDLGFEGAQTLLQSGNVVFKGDGRPAPELERFFESHTKTRLGVETDYFVRTAREWKSIVERNPFVREAKHDPHHMVVLFLKKAPAAREVAALQAAIKGPEVLETVGKQAYIVYPEDIGHSKLTAGLIETKLGTRGTGRNWNTVLKLLALCG